MTVARYECIICDNPAVTLRRLRPHKVYMCVGCLRKRGNNIESLIPSIPGMIEKFRERHKMK